MQNLKLFRPSSGPAKELCSHFESTISTSANAARGIEFHQTAARFLKGEIGWSQVPKHLEKPMQYAVSLIGDPDTPQIDVEIELPLLDREGGFITSGTIDVWRRPPIRPEIIDWKTGQERDYWMQVSIYGVVLIDSLFPTPRENIEIDLTLAFVDQEHHFTETHTYCELRNKVDSLVQDIRDPTSPYSINQYCGYCDLRGRCPAWDKERALVAGSNLALSERLEMIKSDPVTLARFIVAFRRFGKLVENEDLEGLAIQYLKSGQDLPGLKLVHSEGRETYGKLPLAQAMTLWEKEYEKPFPITRQPYEYLKMIK